MNPQVLIEETLWLLIILAGAPLIASMVVGIFVSVFQAVTQIQEQTLTFVPKLLTVFVLWMVFGPRMGASLIAFTQQVFLSVHGNFQ
jgi:flagellar biosynthetic protein FliQ